MTTTQAISAFWHRPRGRRWLAVAAFAVLAMGAMVLWGGEVATRFYFAEAQARSTNTLRLVAAVLRGHMAPYKSLPSVIADVDRVQMVVKDQSDPELLEDVNRYLKKINTQFGSSDIYVMTENGTTVVASNYDVPATFIGDNFRYRPYFYDAISGGAGEFFGLGTTSFKRGYYFGAPIWVDGDVLGVVAVKADIDFIEETWRGGDYEIVVTDPEGIIFMSSRADWLYNSMLPLTLDRLARTAETRRYADVELRELPMEQVASAAYRLFHIESLTVVDEYLVVSEFIREAGWTISVLLDTSSARAQIMATIVIALLVIALGILATASYILRRARLSERLHLQHEAKTMLERRVVERTSELASVNIKLEEEVAERRTTEQMLRKSQSALVQAGKLAALGQMSAALSHEFNQPLAAARNYADNALVLIDRGRIDEARATIGRISNLVDRMGAISRHLRNFARKPEQRLTSVLLEPVIDDTLEILNWRIKKSRIQLSVNLGASPLTVVAGPIRLQQVLVNILSNAIDAVEGKARRNIAISVARNGGRVFIAMRDCGPGIAAGLGQRIFDPFFSTKGVGKGLGLGLSISYNIIKDFGGELHVKNHPDGGALVTVELDAATTDEMKEATQ